VGQEQQVATLSYAVRGRVVLKYFGQLCLVLAVLTTVTLVVSIIFGEYYISIRYAAVITVLAVAGVLLDGIQVPKGVQINEGLVITALIFIVTPLAMTLPTMASGLPFTDGLFEAVSAITTTGLSTIQTLQGKPMTFLFSRAWMQWVGGLGIVVLSAALLFGPGTAARHLAYPDMEAEDLAGGTRYHARRILTVYIVITLAGFLMLFGLRIGLFRSIVHTLAAVSTGGFSSLDNSLAGLRGWKTQAAVILISFMGAISFSLYYFAYRKGRQEVLKHPEARAILCSGIVFTALLFVTLRLWGGFDTQYALRHAPLMAFSAQTTAGFSSLDVGKLDPASKLLLIFPMLIGGNLGSTAGGIKIFRLLVLLRLIALAVQRTRLPTRAVVEPRIGRERLESGEIERALVVVLLFALTVLISWAPFVAMGYDPLDSLFEVVSATGTVGLSTGVTSAGLPALLKGVLCFDMLMGRLEILAILVMLYPGTWLGRRAEI
jgi:trk system potassium uptake protein TrkH